MTVFTNSNSSTAAIFNKAACTHRKVVKSRMFQAYFMRCETQVEKAQENVSTTSLCTSFTIYDYILHFLYGCLNKKMWISGNGFFLLWTEREI
jgi:hypothetical protein